VLFGSLAAILAFTLVPQDAGNDVDLIPLHELVEAIGASDAMRLLELLGESAANVLLFAPLGIALALRGVSKAKTTVLAAALAATVELVQLFVVSGRTTSVDDVALNTLGAVLGHVLLTRVTADQRPHGNTGPT
jgi:glycopeptide antibiotics resistance protein